MIECIPNKTLFGKRVGYKALLQGQTIATAETVTKCKAVAQALLEEVYVASQQPMVVRVARDGTVFVARWIGSARMEYWIQHPDLQGSACMGACETSLTAYMDKVVADYDACTEAA